MEKKELKEEIKKVLEGKSIYEMSPVSGLSPMTKEEIIYWIVETYIDQELDKAREEGRESMIAELSISENMEKIERFFREAPIDYDDKCNLWFDFLSKLTTK